MNLQISLDYEDIRLALEPGRLEQIKQQDENDNINISSIAELALIGRNSVYLGLGIIFVGNCFHAISNTDHQRLIALSFALFGTACAGISGVELYERMIDLKGRIRRIR